MELSVAVACSADAYDASIPNVHGRMAAGEGFLRAYLRFGHFDTLSLYTPDINLYHRMLAQCQNWAGRPLQVTMIHPSNQERLSDASVLYRPDPAISRFAWQRFQASSYSLCGVTYTLSERITMEALSELHVAPVYPWDALICISESGKKLVNNLLDNTSSYIAERFGNKPQLAAMLPVIPLGIDTARFLDGRNKDLARNAWRAQQNVNQSSAVILFSGRLTPFTKANPIPMFMGLEGVALKLNAPLVLICAGWFENAHDEEMLYKAAASFAPSIRLLVLKRPTAEELPKIYAASDIFVSLADNVQETFGLTPIEAMAAGLPVVVSDWDGYRETVRNNIDGITIPSVIPPPGSGSELAAAYLRNGFSHSAYAGMVSMSTAISIPQFTEAIASLVESAERRHEFGRNGRAHVLKNFDWEVVIRQYENLWKEQSKIRRACKNSSYSTKDSHRLPDPFDAFSGYATRALCPDSILEMGSGEIGFQKLQHHPFAVFALECRLSQPQILSLLSAIEKSKRTTVKDLLAAMSTELHPPAYRTLAYLVKFDVLRLAS